MNTERNQESKNKDKINQPEVTSRTNDDFPNEFEEQRDDNIRMIPQPLEKSAEDSEDENSK